MNLCAFTVPVADSHLARFRAASGTGVAECENYSTLPNDDRRNSIKAMSPSVKRTSFLVIGIVGCLLVAADLVLLIFDPTNLVTHFNLFVGLCLIFVGFVNVRALRRPDQKRHSNESRSNGGDASD